MLLSVVRCYSKTKNHRHVVLHIHNNLNLLPSCIFNVVKFFLSKQAGIIPPSPREKWSLSHFFEKRFEGPESVFKTMPTHSLVSSSLTPPLGLSLPGSSRGLTPPLGLSLPGSGRGSGVATPSSSSLAFGLGGRARAGAAPATARRYFKVSFNGEPILVWAGGTVSETRKSLSKKLFVSAELLKLVDNCTDSETFGEILPDDRVLVPGSSDVSSSSYTGAQFGLGRAQRAARNPAEQRKFGAMVPRIGSGLSSAFVRTLSNGSGILSGRGGTLQRLIQQKVYYEYQLFAKTIFATRLPT